MVGFSWLLIFIVFGLDDLCIVWWLVVALLAGFCFISLFVGFRVLLVAEVVGWFIVVDRCLDLAVLVV